MLASEYKPKLRLLRRVLKGHRYLKMPRFAPIRLDPQQKRETVSEGVFLSCRRRAFYLGMGNEFVAYGSKRR